MHPILFRIPLGGLRLPHADYFERVPVFRYGLVAGVVLVIAWYLMAGLAGKRDGAERETAGKAKARWVGIAGLAVLALTGALYGLKLVGNIKEVPIYSYGVMLGLSLVVGWYLTLRLADADGLPKETMANCYVVTAFAAIIGSRLLYVLTNLSEFNEFADIFAFRRGGLVAYGGFLGGYLGSWAYLKYNKLRLLPWADVAVPSLASGLLITRIGCYLFGCDFGQPLGASAPRWLKALGTFPHWKEGTIEHGQGSPAWVHHVQHYGLGHDAAASLPVHPTQIYESLVGLALLGLLLWQRKHQRFRGQVFMLFAFAYGFGRFLIEMVRDDAERGLYGPHLDKHLFLAGSLAIFAIGYALSFAQAVENVTVRRATQVLAFVPAVVAYLVLRPASFADAVPLQLSTSQWVGLLTALAVSGAFPVFWKVAEAHPQEAMELHLEEFLAKQAEAERAVSEAKDETGARRQRKDDDRDADEARPAKSEKAAREGEDGAPKKKEEAGPKEGSPDKSGEEDSGTA
jgi:phosphatidylglycerol:prolipoprotein diacylglycerol transferase